MSSISRLLSAAQRITADHDAAGTFPAQRPSPTATKDDALALARFVVDLLGQDDGRIQDMAQRIAAALRDATDEK